MEEARPKVFPIAQTRIDRYTLRAFFDHLGVEWATDAYSEAEELTEVAGKLCYMSFDTSLNQNLSVTGSRKNFDYIQQGLISTKHGSVLEHATVSFIFADVSRVFTHELVRHRAGAAYSQTSGRFVRGAVLKFFMPSILRVDPSLEVAFRQAISDQEAWQEELVAISGINDMQGRESFSLKKKLTSAFRRILGGGQATNILATYNHRTLRHLIEQRTSRDAEEEIRMVFEIVYSMVKDMFPAIYADAEVEMVDGYLEVTFRHVKV